MNLHETADRGPKIHSETGRTGRAVHGHDPTSARRAVPTILTSRSAARELQSVDVCLRTLMSTDGERGLPRPADRHPAASKRLDHRGGRPGRRGRPQKLDIAAEDLRERRRRVRPRVRPVCTRRGDPRGVRWLGNTWGRLGQTPLRSASHLDALEHL